MSRNPKYYFTFTLADDAGNASLIKISNEGGGINLSPFLTAPLTSIVLAFGLDKILKERTPLTKDKNNHHTLTEYHTNFVLLNSPLNQLKDEIP